MNTPHPYRQAAGRIGCADCGKSRTHMSHLGQGEDEPEQPDDAQQDPIGDLPVSVQPAAREYARQQSEQATRDESSFSITSSGGYTTVLIKVAGPVTPELLHAASVFMQEAQPQEGEK